MKITDQLSSFFKACETEKAKMLHDNVKKFIQQIIGFVVGEYICDRCGMSTLIPEIPGEFLDFDADHDRGGDGIPLCSGCLGTGKVIKSKRFKKLSKEVSKIRSKSLGIQINKAKQPWADVRNQVDEINNRLIEIAKEGLAQVRYPVKGCLALELTNEEENTTSE